MLIQFYCTVCTVGTFSFCCWAAHKGKYESGTWVVCVEED